MIPDSLDRHRRSSPLGGKSRHRHQWHFSCVRPSNRTCMNLILHWQISTGSWATANQRAGLAYKSLDPSSASQYGDARRACQPLARLTARHVFLACLSDIGSLTGQATKSQNILRELLDHPGVSDSERLWISTMLAEIAARTGDTQMADRAFSEILKTGMKNQYLLGTYADFLLDRGRLSGRHSPASA